jgi:microcystin-dependent protein
MSATPYVGEIILVAFNFAPVGYEICDGRLMSIAENDTLFQLIGTTYGGDGQETFALPNLSGRLAVGTGAGPGLTNYQIGDSGGQESVTLTAAQMPAHAHAVDASQLTAAVRVRNGAANQLSPAGNVFASDAPLSFSNPVLTPRVDVIRAAHITELRTQINVYRGQLGLASFVFSDSLVPGSSVVKAVHILELRAALHEAYVQAGLLPPSYTDPALVPGTTAKALHISQIRDAVNAVASAPPTYGAAAALSNMSPAAISAGVGTAANAGGGQPHDNMQPYMPLTYCIAIFGIFPPPA